MTELADGPHHVTLDPEPQGREVSPPPARTANTKGPDVYYPPGAEFTKSVQVTPYNILSLEPEHTLTSPPRRATRLLTAAA